MVIAASFSSLRTTSTASIMTLAALLPLLIAFLQTCAHLERCRKVGLTRVIWKS
jgi:hypothetical protein